MRTMPTMPTMPTMMRSVGHHLSTGIRSREFGLIG
jgi:hypothetical protein